MDGSLVSDGANASFGRSEHSFRTERTLVTDGANTHRGRSERSSATSETKTTLFLQLYLYNAVLALLTIDLDSSFILQHSQRLDGLWGNFPDHVV